MLPDLELNAQVEGQLDEMLEYLDELRESGITNMFGARPYLMSAFDLTGPQAAKILTHWMRTFIERHPVTP